MWGNFFAISEWYFNDTAQVDFFIYVYFVHYTLKIVPFLYYNDDKNGTIYSAVYR